jgi:hypothetical protein
LGIPLLTLTLSTAAGGVVMFYLSLFLIPIVALLALGSQADRNRRRREITGHDVNTAVYTVRQDAERKYTEWTAGT